MSPADMAIIRARLEALRPQFERLGRHAWWVAMMDRMEILSAAAHGTESRLHPDVAPGDVVQLSEVQVTTPAKIPPAKRARAAAKQTVPTPVPADAPKASRAPVGKAAKYQVDLAGIEDLSRAAESPQTDEKLLTEGNARTSIVTTEDGTRLIKKTTEQEYGDHAGAEQGGSWIAQALGLGAPRVYRNGEDSLYMDLIDARTAAEWETTFGGDQAAWREWEQRAIQSDDGRLVGLLDQLITAGDRNHGNWLVDDNGTIYPIDHSDSFPPVPGGEVEPGFWGPFADHYVGYEGRQPVFVDNPLTQADIAEVRRRIEELRPKFDQIDRSHWLTYALDTLDALAPHARGTRDLIAGKARVL
jgi:hypothetical protein